jgi:hypothetical protein
MKWTVISGSYRKGGSRLAIVGRYARAKQPRTGASGRKGCGFGKAAGAIKAGNAWGLGQHSLDL